MNNKREMWKTLFSSVFQQGVLQVDHWSPACSHQNRCQSDAVHALLGLWGIMQFIQICRPLTYTTAPLTIAVMGCYKRMWSRWGVKSNYFSWYESHDRGFGPARVISLLFTTEHVIVWFGHHHCSRCPLNALLHLRWFYNPPPVKTLICPCTPALLMSPTFDATCYCLIRLDNIWKLTDTSMPAALSKQPSE